VTIYGSRCVRVEPDAGRGRRTQGDVPAAAQEAGRLHPRAGRRPPSSGECCGAGPPPETRERPLSEKRGALQCNSDFILIARSSEEPLCQHTSGDGRDAGDENEHKRELAKEIAGKPWPK